jgi:hypothetical protein
MEQLVSGPSVLFATTSTESVPPNGFIGAWARFGFLSLSFHFIQDYQRCKTCTPIPNTISSLKRAIAGSPAAVSPLCAFARWASFYSCFFSARIFRQCRLMKLALPRTTGLLTNWENSMR